MLQVPQVNQVLQVKELQQIVQVVVNIMTHIQPILLNRAVLLLFQLNVKRIPSAPEQLVILLDIVIMRIVYGMLCVAVNN